jgi:hypothetical protein
MPRDRAQLSAEEQLVESSTTHVAGARELDLAADQCVAVCLIRDGRWYVDGFVEHYLRLGVDHVVFLDNGSTDGTVDRLVGRDRVSVFRCDLPYRDHKLAMKRHLVRRFAGRGWGLCVDSDEHFDYPASSQISMRDFLAYLVDGERDAVRALMLDLYPRASLRASWEAGERWRDEHVYFETDTLKRRVFPADGMPPIDIFWNGVRGRLGVPRLCLTKFPLIRPTGRVRFLEDDAHLVSHANEADVSGLLLHYKFAPCFPARVADALARKQYHASSSEYVYYDAALKADPDLALWTETARRYAGTDDLAGTEYLPASPAFRAWVAQRAGAPRS